MSDDADYLHFECAGGGAPIEPTFAPYSWDDTSLVGDPYGTCPYCGARVALVNVHETYYAIRHFTPDGGDAATPRPEAFTELLHDRFARGIEDEILANLIPPRLPNHSIDVRHFRVNDLVIDSVPPRRRRSDPVWWVSLFALGWVVGWLADVLVRRFA